MYAHLVKCHYTTGSRLNLPWKVFCGAVPVDKIISLFEPLLYASGAARPMRCPAGIILHTQNGSLSQHIHNRLVAPCRGCQM